MDCGPDGMCGSFALEYGWDFNFDRFPDPSHGTNCDFNGGLKAVGLMGLILCMMISWNLPYGPDRDHQRMLQLDGALEMLYKTGTAKSTPLFMKKVDGIIKCLKRNGVRFSGSWSEDEEAFRIRCERMHGRKRGRRMTASRFAAGLQKALECTAWWEVDSFEREYLALEGDMVGNAGLANKIKLIADKEQHAAVAEGGAPSSATQFGMEDKGDLRKSCSNAAPSHD